MINERIGEHHNALAVSEMLVNVDGYGTHAWFLSILDTGGFYCPKRLRYSYLGILRYFDKLSDYFLQKAYCDVCRRCLIFVTF